MKTNVEMTQINTRIPLASKRAGDEVLARFGKTASDIVRAAWEYMERHQRLPEFVAEATPSFDESHRRRLDMVEQGAALLPKLLANLDIDASRIAPADYRDIRDSAYEEALEEYGVLNA